MPSCQTPRFPIRSPKEFLGEKKRHLEKMRERGEEVSEKEIEFLTYVIEHINKEAFVSEKTEKEIYRDINWKWWSETTESNWELFANITNSFRELY